MDEQASFELRAVLAPRRAGWNRLAVVVPALALVAVAWAGVSARSDQNVAVEPNAVAVAASTDIVASPAVAQPYPAQAVGLDVHPLDAVQPRGLGRGKPTAIAGWYVATSVTDCPPLAAFYRNGSLPEVRGDIAAVDSWAFCDRSGVLYASQPNPDDRLATTDLEANRSRGRGLAAVAVTVIPGVVMPPGLETIGADATQVVVVAHFVDSGSACFTPAGCPQELMVDYLAWAADG